MAGIPFDPDEIARALENEALEIIKEDAVSIARTIILATPVGNPALWKNPPPADYLPGMARGNWHISVGAPDEAVFDRLDRVGANTIAEAITRIDAYAVVGLGLYLENNVPYIGRLNDGWSSQAPAGFIQRAEAVALTDRGSKELP